MKLQRYEYIWEYYYYYYYYSIMNIAIESESYFWIINSNLMGDCEKYSRENNCRGIDLKKIHSFLYITRY